MRKQSLSVGQSHLHEHVFWSGTNPQVPAMKNSGIPVNKKRFQTQRHAITIWSIWKLFSLQLLLLISSTAHTFSGNIDFCIYWDRNEPNWSRDSRVEPTTAPASFLYSLNRLLILLQVIMSDIIASLCLSTLRDYSEVLLKHWLTTWQTQTVIFYETS